MIMHCFFYSVRPHPAQVFVFNLSNDLAEIFHLGHESRQKNSFTVKRAVFFQFSISSSKERSSIKLTNFT